MDGQLIERTTEKDKKLRRRRWQLRVFLGYDQNRKQRFKFETFIGKAAGAKERLRELLFQHGKGELAQVADMALADYLKAWLTDALEGSVSRKTFSDYSALIRLYILPALGHTKLARLAPLQVQNLYGKLRARGLSARTIRYTHNVLNKALKQAVRWGYLARNPADGAELPKQQRREMRALTPDDARGLLKAAKGTRFAALWNLALDTGMRPEEYLALKWSDLRDGTAHVQRVVCANRSGGGYYFDATKTAKSRRAIPLTPQTIALLELHRARQRQERFKAGPRWLDLDLVFATHNGTPIGRRNLARDFKFLLEAAKLPREFNLYSLRHTAATLLLAANIHPKIVSARLGHASITLTLDTYSHVLPDMQQGASDALEAILFPPEKSAR